MTIEKVKVRVETDYQSQHKKEYFYEVVVYKVVLEIPLPGGKAIYEIPIEHDMYENLNKAAALSV